MEPLRLRRFQPRPRLPARAATIAAGPVTNSREERPARHRPRVPQLLSRVGRARPDEILDRREPGPVVSRLLEVVVARGTRRIQDIPEAIEIHGLSAAPAAGI